METKADTKKDAKPQESKLSKNEKAVEAKKPFTQKLSDFFTKNRTPLLIGIIVILAVLVVVCVYSIVSNSMMQNSSRAMEEVRTKITEWSAETDQTKKDASEKTIQNDLDAIVKKWPKSFAAQESLYAKSTIAASKKDWPTTEKYAVEAAGRLPKTYLAPIALEAAAVAAEEQGSADKAIEYYNRIVTTYKVDTPNLPHAYFALGRLAEGKSDWKAALDNYQKLIADFPDSDWSKLAKDRVVYLNAVGRGSNNK